MAYQVSIIGKNTIIAEPATGFRMTAAASEDSPLQPATAFAIATLYQERNGFTPIRIYHFTAVDNNEQPLTDTHINTFKAAIDFFFRTIQNTDLYVKEIPQNSALYTREAVRIYGHTLVAA